PDSPARPDIYPWAAPSPFDRPSPLSAPWIRPRACPTTRPAGRSIPRLTPPWIAGVWSGPFPRPSEQWPPTGVVYAGRAVPGLVFWAFLTYGPRSCPAIDRI